MQDTAIETKGRKYHPQLDLLKGLSIYLVLMGHIFPWSAEGDISSLLIVLLMSFHVPAFILVSGFLASRPIKSWFSYWSGKVQQLLVPMFFAAVIVCWLFSRSWSSLIYSASHAGYWFNYVLFLLFILYALFRYIYSLIERIGWDVQISLPKLDAKFPLGEVLVALASIALMYGVKYILLSDSVLYDLFSWGWVATLYPIFLLGHFIAKYEFLHKIYTHKYTSLVAFILAAITITQTYLKVPGFDGMPMYLVATCVVYNICYAFASSEGGIARVLRLLGKNTLGIYLWHYVFVWSLKFPMRDWLYQLSGGTGNVLIWELIIMLIMTSVVALLSYGLVSVFRFNPILKRLFLGETK